ncbi:competence protein ComFB [Ectothiorhodospira haloalkaliphila]|uniref:Competence protein ComFB n=1 Tax=Ectothiorhodospira haloalkaliphila TaxID=421628 RepID=W8KJ90_9GAMM|nr:MULTISPECIES: late competence development ComFB family protein [Ectothiorhodospira]AHK79859.1 competence protein ComFB [Ectothiorhodospira haloalkaliphila]MCG5494168.1 late competence development ComFB family protein [Ectothiorhodospira variabilis]MCG5497399.1 late competence development ComFB family protein [Ectothiorhodospira variabilis]MCG5503302.1 late competence development ComFB family protein [Ectothiorhodospira variabilis]MCG5506610.1 late competence development ComFB family protein
MIGNIQNYYEHLVYDRIRHVLLELGDALDTTHMDDLACVALNRLPPRYVRFSVDLTTRLTDEDWELISSQVNEAVDYAMRTTGRRQEIRLGEDE